MPYIEKSQDAKRQHVLIVLFSFLVIASFIAVLCRVYIRGDYMLSSEVECDPAEESCFVRECEEDCDPEAMQEYYKVRTLAANYASTCNPSVELCPAPLCSEIATCVERLCTEENVPEGEWCNNPQTYRDTFPSDEEESESGDIEEKSSKVDD